MFDWKADLTGSGNQSFKCDIIVDCICLKFLSQIRIERCFVPASVFQHWAEMSWVLHLRACWQANPFTFSFCIITVCHMRELSLQGVTSTFSYRISANSTSGCGG